MSTYKQNNARRQRAHKALQAYAEYTGRKCLTKDDAQDLYTDLVADLLHSAHLRHFDSQAIIRRATQHFEAERD